MIRLVWYLTLLLFATRRTTPMTDTHTLPDITMDDPDDPTGDLVATGDNPIINVHSSRLDNIHVQVDITLAYQPNGHHAIRCLVPENVTMTAAQAHQLHVHLAAAAEAVANVRRDAGYQS